MERFQSKDFWAGLLFVGLGTLVLILGADLRLGTPRSMGPGFVPRMLAFALMGLGALIAGRAFLARGERLDIGVLRPIALIVLGVAVFILLFIQTPFFPWNGLAPALIALVFIASMARTDWRLGETLATAAVLLALCIVIFKLGLGMTFPILRGVW